MSVAPTNFNAQCSNIEKVCLKNHDILEKTANTVVKITAIVIGILGVLAVTVLQKLKKNLQGPARIVAELAYFGSELLAMVPVVLWFAPVKVSSQYKLLAQQLNQNDFRVAYQTSLNGEAPTMTSALQFYRQYKPA
jgi:hypothetical protein